MGMRRGTSGHMEQHVAHGHVDADEDDDHSESKCATEKDGQKRKQKTKKKKKNKRFSRMDRHEYRPNGRHKRCVKALFPLIVYLIFGGWMFSWLELSTEKAANKALKSEKARANEILNLDPSNVTSEMLEELSAYINSDKCSQPKTEDHEFDWHFPGGLFFAMTIVSTVGYGSYVPTTAEGKAFTCAYAILGISYFGFVLTLASDEIVYWVRLGMKRVKQLPKVRLTVKTLWMLFFMNIFIIILCSLMGLWMNWDYGDAFYFAVITFTTVGLGDFTPAFTKYPNKVYKTVGFSVFGLGSLIGLSALAAFVNGLGDYFETDMQVPGTGHIHRHLKKGLRGMKNRMSNLSLRHLALDQSTGKGKGESEGVDGDGAKGRKRASSAPASSKPAKLEVITAADDIALHAGDGATGSAKKDASRVGGPGTVHVDGALKSPSHAAVTPEAAVQAVRRAATTDGTAASAAGGMKGTRMLTREGVGDVGGGAKNMILRGPTEAGNKDIAAAVAKEKASSESEEAALEVLKEEEGEG